MPTQADLALQAIQGQQAQPQGGTQAQMTQADRALAALRPTEQTVSGEPLSRFDRVMKGLNDVSTAGAQFALHALPNGVVNAVNSATAKVNSLPYIGPVTQALGMVPATATSLDQDIKDTEKTYQAARANGNKTLSDLVTGKPADPGPDWYRMAGNFVGSAPLAAIGPAAATIKTGAAMGAVGSALTQPVTEGDFWKEKGKQSAIGAVSGGAVTGLVNGLARMVSPKTSPDVKTLLDAGVTPTPGQILGGGFKRAEEAATSIPVVGDMVRNAQRRSIQQLNTAAINRSLDPIGEKLPADKVGREAIDYAGQKISAAYDNVLNKIGAVKPDEQFVGDLANLSGLVQNLPKEKADQFGRIIDNEILNRIDATGHMTGEGIKAAESNLGAAVRGYMKSGDYDARQLGTALQEAQSSMRNMLGRTSPETATSLQKINQAYANFLRTQEASARVGAEGGVFTPDQLQSAVRALDSTRRKSSFATGQAVMQDLSEAGKNVLGNKLPDSGTPFRHAVQAGAAAAIGHSVLPEAAAAMVVPAAAAGGVASLPYTATGQKIAAALLASRGPSAKLTAEQIKLLAPYLATGGGSVAVPAAE